MSTTQAQLLELADKHKANPTVAMLLTSLSEARLIAQQGLRAVRAAADLLERSVAAEPGFSVGSDHTSIVTDAAKASGGLARMWSDYLALAIVLQSLGEDVSY
jgi:hypothetical protein